MGCHALEGVCQGRTFPGPPGWRTVWRSLSRGLFWLDCVCALVRLVELGVEGIRASPLVWINTERESLSPRSLAAVSRTPRIVRGCDVLLHPKSPAGGIAAGGGRVRGAGTLAWIARPVSPEACPGEDYVGPSRSRTVPETAMPPAGPPPQARWLGPSRPRGT